MTNNIPEGMITVANFAELKGISATKVVIMINDGKYHGKKIGDDWFIDKSELLGKKLNYKLRNRMNKLRNRMNKLRNTISDHLQGGGEYNEVIVTGINIPFWSLVIFMMKWVIASIPATILLAILFNIVFSIFSLILT